MYSESGTQAVLDHQDLEELPAPTGPAPNPCIIQMGYPAANGLKNTMNTPPFTTQMPLCNTANYPHAAAKWTKQSLNRAPALDPRHQQTTERFLAADGLQGRRCGGIAVRGHWGHGASCVTEHRNSAEHTAERGTAYNK